MPLDAALLLDYAVRSVWALVVIVIALLVARALRHTTMRMLARSRAQANVTILLGNLAQVLVILLGVLGVLAIYTRDAFGWILTAVSAFGLVIGLSLQDILKNFFAGIWVLVERPFRIGDSIDIGGYTGTVEEIAFRTTSLKTVDGREVVVPNGLFMTSAVVNQTRFPTRRATLWLIVDPAQGQVGVDAIRAALADVAEITPDPKPLVELRSVAEGKAHYFIAFWAADSQSAASAAVSALRARFPQGEVHGA